MEDFNHIDSEINAITGTRTEQNCDLMQSREVSQAIANVLNKRISRESLNYDKVKLSQLKVDGIVALNEFKFSQNQIKDILGHVKSIPVFNGHVPARGDGIRRYLNFGAKRYPFGSYAAEDVIQCPHILQLAFNPNVLALVEQYLGCAPTIYHINMWWSFPGFPPSVAQDYHRDVDDFKFVALFIYLTEVKGGKHGGQHQFIIRTHEEDQVAEILHGDKEKASNLFMPKLKSHGYNQAELYEKLFCKQIKNITGPAGSVFLADTYALHKGVPPLTNDRLVCWIRYGLRKNVAHYDNAAPPLPLNLFKNKIVVNEKTKYILRILASDQSTYVPKYKVLTGNGIKEVNLVNYKWAKEYSRIGLIKRLKEKLNVSS